VRVIVQAGGIALEVDLPEQITTYGLPSDPFAKIVQKLRLEGDVLHVERTVFARATLGAISCEVKLV